MVKKLLAVLLIAVGLFSLVSCACDNSVTVKFETYTSQKIEAQELKIGDKVKEPPTLDSRAGYSFVGWYNGIKKWSFDNDTVSEDTLIHARWSLYLSFIENEDGTLTVVGCNFKTENVIIPTEYNGKTVRAINTHAFADRKNLKTVYIPNTVTLMGDEVFKGCTSLEVINVQFPSKPEGWRADLSDFNVEYNK